MTAFILPFFILSYIKINHDSKLKFLKIPFIFNESSYIIVFKSIMLFINQL